MDLTAIQSLISSVGFPIFACIYMIMNNNKNMEQMNALLTKVCDMIQNNTDATNQLQLMITTLYKNEVVENE